MHVVYGLLFVVAVVAVPFIGGTIVWLVRRRNPERLLPPGPDSVAADHLDPQDTAEMETRLRASRGPLL